MKTIATLFCCSLLLVGCNNSPKTDESSSANAEDSIVLGGDRDENDCIPSAGQTWSQLRKECIQVFNVGQRLNPVNVAPGEAIISSFVLVSDDQSQVELFLPNIEGSVLLFKNADHVYKANSYTYDSTTGTLMIEDQLAYKAEQL